MKKPWAIIMLTSFILLGTMPSAMPERGLFMPEAHAAAGLFDAIAGGVKDAGLDKKIDELTNRLGKLESQLKTGPHNAEFTQSFKALLNESTEAHQGAQKAGSRKQSTTYEIFNRARAGTAEAERLQAAAEAQARRMEASRKAVDEFENRLKPLEKQLQTGPHNKALLASFQALSSDVGKSSNLIKDDRDKLMPKVAAGQNKIAGIMKAQAEKEAAAARAQAAAAKAKTEQKAAEARVKAEQEAAEAKVKAEQEAAEAKAKAEQESADARAKAEGEMAAASKKYHTQLEDLVRAGHAAVYTNSVGMELALIPAGSFALDSYEKEDDFGEKQVVSGKANVTKAFYLGKYPVTQEQWVAVMGEGTNPSKFKGRLNPVESVSWEAVQEFIRRLNQKEGHNRYRLPAEIEWEYAARGGTSTKYFFGEDAALLGDYAWYEANSGDKAHPVGQKKPNPYDLYDIYGNVREFAADWYDWPPISPAKLQFQYHIWVINILSARGGNWESTETRCSSNDRQANQDWQMASGLPDDRQQSIAIMNATGLRLNSVSSGVGFRLALSIE